MKLEINQFGGIIPGTDPINLPENAAQTAKDVDLSEGTIKPWSVTNSFRKLHDGSGNMIGEVDSGDITQPEKPKAPSLSALAALIPDIEDIITSITTESFTRDRTDGTGDENHGPETLTVNDATITPTGFILHCSVSLETKTMIRGQTYEVIGPVYQFNLTHIDNAGSAANYTFPNDLSPGSYQIPSFSIPLYSEANSRDAYQVGTLELVDVDGPQYGGTFTYPGDSGTVTRAVLGGDVDFPFFPIVPFCNFAKLL